MHRLLVSTETLSLDVPELSKENRIHLKVLRPRPGETFELFDGHGRSRVYAWQNGNLSSAPAPSSLLHAPSPPPLTLFACITKGQRWDWTLEKATELGCTRIVPVLSERTIVRIPSGDRAAKRERWLKIIEEAARQSDALWLPELLEPTPFADTLPLVKATHCYVGALTEKTLMLGAALQEQSSTLAPCSLLPAPYALYVGPEGDFTPAELEALCAIATPVSFGTTVLRAETAAIYGLSVLKAKLDVQSR